MNAHIISLIILTISFGVFFYWLISKTLKEGRKALDEINSGP